MLKVMKGKGEKLIFNKKSRDGCVRFKKVQQQESELQSSNPLPITLPNYELTTVYELNLAVY